MCIICGVNLHEVVYVYLLWDNSSTFPTYCLFLCLHFCGVQHLLPKSFVCILCTRYLFLRHCGCDLTLEWLASVHYALSTAESSSVSLQFPENLAHTPETVKSLMAFASPLAKPSVIIKAACDACRLRFPSTI